MPDETPRSPLSDAIRSARIDAGLTQRALAKALKVTGGAVAQWETDRTKPTPANLLDFLRLVGKDPETYLGPNGPFACELVDDPEELALLADFRKRPPDARKVILSLMAGQLPAASAPKRKKKNDPAA